MACLGASATCRHFAIDSRLTEGRVTLENRQTDIPLVKPPMGLILTVRAATRRLMLSVIGAVRQAEREAVLECQRDGKVARLKAEPVMPSEIATRLGIGRASVYRVLGTRTASGQVAE